MINFLLVVALVIALFLIDGLFWLIPLWTVLAEGYAIYLDFKPRKKYISTPAKKTEFRLEDLREHSTEASAYVAIDDKVYDMTEYVDKHPGGREFLLLHVGRDATIPFNSYHPFTEKPRQVLEKYYIGQFLDAAPAKKPEFYKEVSQKVNEYFKNQNINYKNPLPGVLRLIPLLMAMAITFYFGFLSDVGFKTKLVMAVTYGVLQALNSVHLMHDASHGAVGNSQFWWKTIGRLTLDWISGSSMLAWHNQHIVGHHAYTNVYGADPDLPQRSTGDVRRLVPNQVWNKAYEWQIYYLPPLYGLLALRSRWYDIFEIFLLETNGPVKVNPISLQDKLRQSASKLFWLFWRVFVPLQYISGAELFTLFMVTEFVTGYWLAFNFQVSHVSDVAQYTDLKNLHNDEWAILQIKGSVDYAHSSWLWTYLSGALNYQVVHHLFPGVSQYYYPHIAPIVKQVCNKHNVQYNHFETFTEAIKGHFRHLYNMGKQHKWVRLED